MSISPVSFSAASGVESLRNQSKSVVSNNAEPKKETKSKIAKAMPYIAGAAILAVSGYAFRGKIAKILKKSPELVEKPKAPEGVNVGVNSGVNEVVKEAPKTPEVVNTGVEVVKEVPKEPEVKETLQIVEEVPKTPEVKETLQIVEEAPKTPEIKEPSVPVESVVEHQAEEVAEEAPKFKEIFTHFDQEGKPVYEAIEMPSAKGSATSVYSEFLESVNLNDEKIISKIENIRASEQENITRILNENTHDGFVDIPMMKKVATDYMNDVNRGETRFHQAADLLEQTHIKAYLKGDAKERSGMYNLVDSVVTDPVLYRAYQNMPKEESAVRLNYLKEHDLKSESYKESMDAQGFFDKTIERLVDKYQMKRYNEAHGIS